MDILCTLEKARAAKAEALEVFERLMGSCAVGITRVGEGYGLKINLQTQPAPGLALPSEINGVPVKVEVVGAIRKQRMKDEG